MDIHLIGNAHLDPVWLWRWQEGFAETRATFRSALDRMKEFPDFIFTCSAAAIYEWVERADPMLFAEIRERVAEGRWQITGGWWIQPDCNLPSGESFIRQALQAQTYFREKFGVRCRCGYCVDSFGHNASLPKILAGCGFEGWVWMRPHPHENPNIPKPFFRWQSDDGSAVIALRISDQGYNTNSAEDLSRCLAHLENTYRDAPPPGDSVLCFFGVGNHGGGPTIDQLKLIEERRGSKTGTRLVYDSPETFLGRLRDEDLPTYAGELQHHASGCYAAVSRIKTLNREAETRLGAAETWLAAATCALGDDAPKTDLSRAWKDVLFNQFHDILAGTSLPESCDDACRQIGGAIHAADVAENLARQAICARVDTRGDGTPVVVFNPNPAPFRGIVETDDFGFFSPDMIFVDTHGTPVPAQPIRPHSLVGSGGTGRKRAALLLDLPAAGYRLLRLRNRRGDEKAPAPPDPVKASAEGLENASVRLDVGPDGSIRLFDKRFGRSVLTDGAGVPLVIEDRSDTWSHGVFSFDAPPEPMACTGVRVCEEGPLRGAVEVSFAYGDSTVRLRYFLEADGTCIRIAGISDWRSRFRIVKLPFPVACSSESHTSEIPFGAIVRPNNGEEEPTRRWVDVSGPGTGLTVFNRSKYSYDVRDTTIRVTLLRSPLYAHHDPAEPDETGEYPATDNEPQRFALLLAPHAGDRRTVQPHRRAAELHDPPSVLFESSHDGSLPQTASFLEAAPDCIAVTAFKPAEDGEGLVVRAHNTEGRPVTATFRLPFCGASWTVEFGPGDVRTVGIRPERTARPRALDHLETPRNAPDERE